VAGVRKLARLLRNCLLDLRFGGRFLGGTVKTPFADLGATDTASTDYGAMPLVFAGRLQDSDVVVDVGCGKGRVINWLLSRAHRGRIIGIELDPRIAAGTRSRLHKYRNVTILQGDVLDAFPEDGDVYYLYNPFGREVLRGFKERVERAAASRRKAVTVLYYNDVHVDVFEKDARWLVQRVDTADARGHRASALLFPKTEQ
jgi:SAM-dependent methyltransferase